MTIFGLPKSDSRDIADTLKNAGKSDLIIDSIHAVSPDSVNFPGELRLDSSIRVPNILNFFDSVSRATFPKVDSAKIEDESEYSLQYTEFNPVLGKNAIKYLYFQGEFDKIIVILEKFRKSGNMVEKEDSVFVYKYLGVIYGSDHQYRTKGEGYLYSMLRLNPKATMADMQLSGEIEDLFKSVEARFFEDFPYLEQPPEKPLNQSKPVEKKKNLHVLFWAFGGLITIGILTGTVLLVK